MRLFQRVNDIITANLNDLVDHFENPEAMLRQAVREMEASLEQASAAAARAIASESLLARELGEHEREMARWHGHAESAVAADDDALARRALARKHEHEQLARALRDQHAAAADTSRSLRRQVHAMRAKLAEARRKLASLCARQQVAVARKQFRAALPGQAPSVGVSGLARFDQLQAQVDFAEAEAAALTELETGRLDELEADLAAREDAEAIEAELAALKSKVKTRPQPGAGE